MLRYILLAVGIYVVTAAILLCAVALIMYYEHTDTLRAYSDDVANDFYLGLEYDDIDLHSFGILAYNADGECIFEEMPRNPFLEDDASDVYEPVIKKYLNSVMSGKSIDRLMYVPAIGMASMFAASPVQGDGEIKAIFLIRNIQAMVPSLATFLIGYSCLFVVLAVIVISLLKRRYRYNQMQETYVANISHDLKSPITSIRALAETMHEKMPEDVESQKQYTGFIISESIKLEHTVKDILELSSLQTKNKATDKSVVRLSDAFRSTFEKFDMLCYDMMIDFHIEGDLESLQPVRTNPDAIARVMDILLDNAVKFVDTDEGVITVSYEADAHKVTMCIADNGIGMDKETMSHVFERFYMGDKSHNTKGSGLGLAIASEIIANLNERIYVRSALGQGSRFYFTIHY